MATKRKGEGVTVHRMKPCRICRQWFRPDPRVGERQKVCSNPRCQRTRRQRNQEDWRGRNPDYAVEYRIKQKAIDNKRSREPPSVDRLPWELAKDEFGLQGAEFIGSLGRLLMGVAKDQTWSYPVEIVG